MWLMTPEGFVSIVQKPNDRGRGTLTVRARDPQSLAAFAVAAGRDRTQYRINMASDYPYRDTFTRAEVSQALLTYVELITYDNFKNQAKRIAGRAYATVLGRVWQVLLDLEPDEVTEYLDRGRR